MSPEQALGRPVDFRSDQFSLGSILYEMATGKRAFARESAPETLTAIIRDEPEPIGASRRCRRRRFLDRRALPRQERRRPIRLDARPRARSRDLRDRVGEASSGAAAARAETPRRREKSGCPGPSPRRWPFWRERSGSPAGARCGRAVARRPLLRRDAGRRAVRERRDRGTARDLSRRTQARFRRRSAGAQAPLPEIAGFARDAAARRAPRAAISPFWSPDSRSLGFFADGRLQRLDFAGPPRTICEAPSLETLPSWGSAGQILFAQIGPTDPGIYVVDAAGGQPRRVVLKLRRESQTASGHPFCRTASDSSFSHETSKRRR